MNTRVSAVQPSSIVYSLCLLLASLLLPFWVSTVSAQTAIPKPAAFDGTTPASLAPGSAAGSYALSGFDSVNLFSRQLSFALPLMTIGGRGEAGYTMYLPYEAPTWQIRQNAPISCSYNAGQLTCQYATFLNFAVDEWIGKRPGYGAGVMVGRKVGDYVTCYNSNQQQVSCPGDYQLYHNTLTRLTFMGPDGSQIEFIDQSTEGRPLTMGANRQKIWIARDGSAATFISNSDIIDTTVASSSSSAPGIFNANGYIYFKNGIRYKIEDGNVTEIRDRNGNLVRFNFIYDSYGVWLRTEITDAINRLTTYERNGNGDMVISFPGANGTPRQLIVEYRSLSLSIRPNRAGCADCATYPQTAQSVNQLFPNVNNSNLYVPTVISAVVLPDGRRYQLYYTPFKEIARVDLPTGGVIEYDWAGLAPGGWSTCGAGSYTPSTYGDYVYQCDTSNTTAQDLTRPHQWTIKRGVTMRRVYKDANTLESKTIYGYGSTLTKNAAGTILNYEGHTFFGDPSRIPYLATEYTPWKDGRETGMAILDASGVQLRRSETFWEQRAHYSWWTGSSDGEPPNDPRVYEVINTLLDNGSNQVSKVYTSYDPNVLYNQPSLVQEYDYGAGAPGSLLRQTEMVYKNTSSYINTPVHLRSLPMEMIVKDSAGNVKSKAVYEYDNYTTDTLHAGLLGYSGIAGFDVIYSTGFTTRGNITGVTSFTNAATLSGAVSTYQQYDIVGNVVKTIEAGRADGTRSTTTFNYSDNFGVANGNAQNGGLPSNTPPPELSSGEMAFAFVTKVTNELNHTGYTQYDYYLGKPVDVEDQNGVKSSFYYEDTPNSLDRPKKGVSAIGTSVQNQTVFIYNDTNSVLNSIYPPKSVTAISDKDAFGESGNSTPTGLKSVALYDGLGRTYRKATYEGNTGSGNTWSIVETQFDGLGRVAQTCNPFRATDPATGTVPAGTWTTTQYDTLSRAIEVNTPDNAKVKTYYSGNQVLVSDQARINRLTTGSGPYGAQRMSETDALGRLTKVWEIRPADALTGTVDVSFPGHAEVIAGYLTTYDYDALDNLVTVKQRVGTGGTLQTRSFVYDSLKRLTSANNPENGTTFYTYDPNGNVVTKKDARTAITQFSYDALNRIQTKIYTGETTEGINAANATPSVNYYYDAHPQFAPGSIPGNTKGRLVAVTYGPTNTGTYYSYDVLGRTAQSIQQTSVNGVPTNYQLSYAYNLAGQMTSETYPSGRVILTNYDTAGRISNVQRAGTSWFYASQFNYAPYGAVKEVKLGNGLWEQMNYNSRLQLTEIGVGPGVGPLMTPGDVSKLQLLYNYGTTENNGNVLSQTINIAAASSQPALNVTQTYTYDELNRLKIASEGSNWSQTYSYDRFGNRKITGVTGSGINGTMLNFSEVTNRITDFNYGYDSAGNLTNEAGNSRTYDAENRMVSATGGSYSYDGEGRRVKKVAGGVMTIFVYNAQGQLIAEYNDAAPVAGGGTRYLTADHLGSTRLVTSGGSGAVKARYDYLPFGEEIPAGIGGRVAGLPTAGMGYIANPQQDLLRQKFGSKERDSETGLDFFGARYYSSVQGRFTGVDQGSPEVLDPQTWNRYQYARNNPLYYVDPSGNTDVPARAPYINQALATDPTLLEVIKTANNYNQQTFQDQFERYALFYKSTELLSFIGLAGEAVFTDWLKGNYPTDGVFLQAQFVGNVLPDVVQMLPNSKIVINLGSFGRIRAEITTNLINIVQNASGATGQITLGPDVKFVAYEVKAGKSQSVIEKGVQQIETTGKFFKGKRISGVPVLVVDRKAWEDLDADTRADYYSRVTRAGGFIQLFRNLNSAATQRANAMILQAARRQAAEAVRRSRSR